MDFDFSPHRVVGYLRGGTRAGAALRVYIEGDGLAWHTSRWPSADPTPEEPTGLRLAARDRTPLAVLYLARPCQFTGAASPPCEVSLWTHARYSEPVVASVDRAIDVAAAAVDASAVELVGYSGGGVVAALVAARRNDLRLLVTVASPLDHDTWTRSVGATPLFDSLQPKDAAARLRPLAQVHYVGGRDRRVPRGAVDAYVAALGEAAAAFVEEQPDFDHSCCWVEAWPELLDAATRRATPARP